MCSDQYTMTRTAMSAPFMADSALNSRRMTATVHDELLCFMISSLAVSTDPALLFCGKFLFVLNLTEGEGHYLT